MTVVEWVMLAYVGGSVTVVMLMVLGALFIAWRDERDAARRCAALVARPNLREGAPHA